MSEVKPSQIANPAVNAANTDAANTDANADAPPIAADLTDIGLTGADLISTDWAPEVPAFSLPRPDKATMPLALATGLAFLAYGLSNGNTGALSLNLVVWLLAFISLSVWAVTRNKEKLSAEGLTLLGFAFLFGLTFMLREVPSMFAFFNAFSLVLALVLGAGFLRFSGLGSSGVIGLIGSAITGHLRFFYGGPALVERFPWERARPAQPHGMGRWGVGILLTLPVLLVFGGLLASADDNFRRVISHLFTWNFNSLIDTGITLGFWGMVAGGLIYPAVMALRPSLFLASKTNAGKLGLIEIGLPLGTLAALFVVFLALQLPYYLSGSQLPDGLTFAEYIRKGFAELMTVAFLSLALLLSTHSLIRSELRSNISYRLLNLAVLIPLVLVILSAANRWRLYTQAYGLSETRLMGAAFLVWIVLCLGWLAYLLWRDNVQRFAYPALLMGFSTLLIITVLNPADMIAKTNLHRQTAQVTNKLRSQPQQINVWQTLALGSDVIPTFIANLDSLGLDTPLQDCKIATPAANSATNTAPNATTPNTAVSPSNCGQKQDVINRLHEIYAKPRDWRAWNASYQRAYDLVKTLPPSTGISSRTDSIDSTDDF